MRQLLLACFLLPSAAAQTITVRSAAIPALSGFSVAPGSMVVASGYPLPLARDLSGVRLELKSRTGGPVLALRIVGADSVGIWAVMPQDAPVGWADFTMTSQAVTLTGLAYVSRSLFGLFSVMRDGSGPAIAQNIAANGAPSANQLTSPAVPGQYVTLWATGLGDYTTSDVSLDVAGVAVQPTFAGHSPGLPGLDQINFQIPAGVPTSCYIPVIATAHGSDVTNAATVAIVARPGDVCAHPLGLSAGQMKQLDGGATIVLGLLDFWTDIISDASGGFTRRNEVGASFLAADSRSVFGASGAYDSGAVTPVCSLRGVPAIDSGDVPAPPIAHRDAGASLTLSGPNQKTVVIAASAGEYFKALDQPPIVLSAADVPAPFFSDGPWIVSGAGGADVAAFQRTFTLPPPIKWTNRDAFALVDRSAGFTVAWDAQGYGPTEFVTAQILSFPPPHTTLPTGLSAGVSCRVPAQTGKLVFTPDWLQKIVPTLPGFESSVWLDVSSNTARPRMFTVALKDGSLAPVIVTSSLSDGSATVIR